MQSNSMTMINLNSEKGNFQATDSFGNVITKGLYKNDVKVSTKEQLYELIMKKQYVLSRVNMQLYPNQKYHFWLDLDNLKSFDAVEHIIKLLISLDPIFTKHTITFRQKADKTLSYHVVFYETIFSQEFIKELGKNLFMDNDIDPSVYSTDRLFKEVYQNKFGKENSYQIPYKCSKCLNSIYNNFGFTLEDNCCIDYTLDTCEYFTPQLFNQDLQVNENKQILNRPLDITNILNMYKSSLQNPSDKKDTLRFNYLKKNNYSLTLLHQLRDSLYVSKDKLSYKQHQEQKKKERLSKAVITPSMQKILTQQQSLQDTYEIETTQLKQDLEIVQNELKSSKNQKLMTKKDSLLKRLDQKLQKFTVEEQKLHEQFLQNITFDFEPITFLTEQQNKKCSKYFDYLAIYCQEVSDVIPNEEHSRHVQRIELFYAIVDIVFNKLKVDSQLCKILVQRLINIKVFTDDSFSGIPVMTKMDKLIENYDQKQNYKTLEGLFSQYNVKIQIKQEIVKEDLQDYSINLNDPFTILQFLKINEFESLEQLLQQLSRVFVYIQHPANYYVKKYNTFTKKNELERKLKTNFNDEYSIYFVTIKQQKFKLIDIIKENILLLSKFSVQFCQFDNESIEDYFFLFQYTFQQNPEFTDSDVDQINSGIIEKLDNPFLQHIYEIWFQENVEKFIYFIKLQSWQLKNISKKSKVVPVILGEPGCGKNIVTDAISKLYGNFALPNVDDISIINGEFNEICADMKFIVCNELKDLNGKTDFDKLKTKITETSKITNEKNVSRRKDLSFENYIFVSNNYNCVKVERGDRRYFPLKCSSKYCQVKGADNTDKLEYFEKVVGPYADNSQLLFNIFMSIDTENFKPEKIPYNELLINMINGQSSNVIKYISEEFLSGFDNHYEHYVDWCEQKGENKQNIRSFKFFWRELFDHGYSSEPNKLNFDKLNIEFHQQEEQEEQEKPLTTLQIFIRDNIDNIPQYFQYKELYQIYLDQQQNEYETLRKFSSALVEQNLTEKARKTNGLQLYKLK